MGEAHWWMGAILASALPAVVVDDQVEDTMGSMELVVRYNSDAVPVTAIGNLVKAPSELALDSTGFSDGTIPLMFRKASTPTLVRTTIKLLVLTPQIRPPFTLICHSCCIFAQCVKAWITDKSCHQWVRCVKLSRTFEHFDADRPLERAVPWFVIGQDLCSYRPSHPAGVGFSCSILSVRGRLTCIRCRVKRTFVILFPTARHPCTVGVLPWR
jgi:hypothetical protein